MSHYEFVWMPLHVLHVQRPYHWLRGLDAPRHAHPASEACLWLRPGRTLHGLLRDRGPLHNQRSADQAPDEALVVDELGARLQHWDASIWWQQQVPANKYYPDRSTVSTSQRCQPLSRHT